MGGTFVHNSIIEPECIHAITLTGRRRPVLRRWGAHPPGGVLLPPRPADDAQHQALQLRQAGLQRLRGREHARRVRRRDHRQVHAAQAGQHDHQQGHERGAEEQRARLHRPQLLRRPLLHQRDGRRLHVRKGAQWDRMHKQTQTAVATCTSSSRGAHWVRVGPLARPDATCLSMNAMSAGLPCSLTNWLPNSSIAFLDAAASARRLGRSPSTMSGHVIMPGGAILHALHTDSVK